MSLAVLPDGAQSCPPPSAEGPDSIDSSIFIDDDVDGDLSDDGSFTMIDDNEIGSIPAHEPDVDARHHFRRQLQYQEPKTSDKMKSKIVSFWHNVKYGWSETVKPKSNFKKRKAIFLLSQHYDCGLDSSDVEDISNVLIKFKQDFTSRIWLTYRHGFTPITDTQITSDSGWGCMIRSGQMMLAQGLLLHYLGRNWNMFTEQSEKSELFHREIIRWFSDQPSQKSPFSIHRLVNISKGLGRKAGDWYGPAMVATIMEQACQIASDFTPLLKDICFYVGHDCTIYKQDVLELATTTGGSGSSSTSFNDPWRSVIIVVPVRLGTEELNPIYIPCLKGLFCLESFLGIIGGKPKHSLYFIGFQDNKLIHLDPHLMQDTVDTSQKDFPLESYHCACPRKLSFQSMDPSCALGFYCRTRADFDNLLDKVEAYLIPPDSLRSYPIFVVSKGSRNEHINLY